MFLEDKLENMYDLGIKYHSMTHDLITDLLNACVHHIADRVSDGMKAYDVAQVVKQADKIWRTFCKKHDLGETAENLFKQYYIDERCINHPQLGKFFKGE